MVSASQAPRFEYQDGPVSKSQDEEAPDVREELSEEDLRELIRSELLAHLRAIGLTGDVKAAEDLDDKTRIRLIHAMQRSYLLARERPLIEKHGPRLINYFANGSEIDPE